MNQWWICDEGRYGWKHVFDQRRLVEPRVRRDGVLTPVDWEDAIRELDAALRGATRLAVVLSPHLTVEEAYLLAKYAQEVQPSATLILGPVPTRGEDQSFAGGFTIRAEKCPNRRGVRAGARCAGRPWDHMGRHGWRSRRQRRTYDAIWIAGGYKTDWNDADHGGQAGRHAAAHRAGSVSFAAGGTSRLAVAGDGFCRTVRIIRESQRPAADIRVGVRPPRGVLSEGQLLWRLLGRHGLYNAPQVLAEVAEEIVYFCAALRADPRRGCGSESETAGVDV